MPWLTFDGLDAQQAAFDAEADHHGNADQREKARGKGAFRRFFAEKEDAEAGGNEGDGRIDDGIVRDCRMS